MKVSLEEKLVVAISSRALFDFEEENQVFEQGDDDAYMNFQRSRLGIPAKPGVAFSLVEKLLTFNSTHPPLQDAPVEVVVLSRNDPITGLRVMQSVTHYDLPINRSIFTRGTPPWRYLHPLKANLFLSANPNDVKAALQTGFPSARVCPTSTLASKANPHEVRIAFDGDAVLFSDEAEKIFQTQGLRAFQEHERSKAKQPLPAGPFKPFLIALHTLQKVNHPVMKIRTTLVTARNAPAHERAIRTLMDWNIDIDEAMFLGGLDKGTFLREFEPDFFFDDQLGHIESASAHVPAGQVISGIAGLNTPTTP